MGSADLEDAAARALADPDDPGGRAGRSVTRGVSVREKVRIETDDPVSVRGDEVQGDPAAPRFKASGLASGSVTDCGAGLAQAEAGGACGFVAWCVGADCETRSSQASTGFVDAATKLNMVLELGGDEFDRENLLFFRGERRSCRIRWGGLANCCKNSGPPHRTWATAPRASDSWRRSATPGRRIISERGARSAYSGSAFVESGSGASSAPSSGGYFSRRRGAQLGIGWGSCRGFTVSEMERIDFEAVDLSEFTDDLMDGASEPSVTLPGAGDTGSVMRGRIRDFYDRNK